MKTFSGWIFISYALFFVFLGACTDQSIPTQPTIIVTSPPPPLRIGLSDSAIALEHLARLTYDEDPGLATLQFLIGNDQTLLADLDAGRLDAVLVYNVPESGDHWFNPVALDGLVIITHPEIQVHDMGLQALKPLFTGIVTNWSIFGLAEDPVVLLIREPGSGAEAIFNTLVMDGASVTPNSLITINEMDMLSTVSTTQGAIGYGMMGSVDGPGKIAIDGTQATPETTADQTYPLTTPIYFAVKEEPSGDLRHFLSNLLSETGQNIIGEKFRPAPLEYNVDDHELSPIM